MLIPPAVWRELRQERTPESVRLWAENIPDWLELRTPVGIADQVLSELGPGEREAIALASELPADVLIMDDLHGRNEARRRHLTVFGTLRVLGDAAEAGLVDLTEALRNLQKTTFRASEELVQSLLERYAKQKQF